MQTTKLEWAQFHLAALYHVHDRRRREINGGRLIWGEWNGYTWTQVDQRMAAR